MQTFRVPVNLQAVMRKGQCSKCGGELKCLTVVCLKPCRDLGHAAWQKVCKNRKHPLGGGIRRPTRQLVLLPPPGIIWNYSSS
jgi:hypothetical protein